MGGVGVVDGGVWYDAKTGEYGHFGSAEIVGAYGWEMGVGGTVSAPNGGLSLYIGLQTPIGGDSMDVGNSSNGDTTASLGTGAGAARNPGEIGGRLPTTPAWKNGCSALAGLEAAGSESCGRFL